jgi:REP element-mobilizing transposase RayT
MDWLNNAERHRRSIRLQGYDYSRNGAYFVTVCVQHRECLLGEIVDDEMRLNDAGRMVERWWVELGNKFPSVETDEFVVMPNHFHGIITIVGADLRVCPDRTGAHIGAPLRHGPLQRINDAPLPEIVQWFKTMTTNEYIRTVKQHGWVPLPGRLWQRNYYERVIRTEEELRRIRQYITDNPSQWAHDRENPRIAM